MLKRKIKWSSLIAVTLVISLMASLFQIPVRASADSASIEQTSSSAIVSQPVIQETVSEAGFVHPSIGFSTDTLQLMQQKIAIGAEPWASAFESFRNSSSGSLDYDIRNQSKIDPSKPAYTKIDNDAKAKEAKVDAEAAFTDAVIWAATGDIRYREKAMQIIRLWSQIDPANPKGFTDSHISIGDALSNMIRAAELLRYTVCEGEWGWTEQDTANFNHNFLMAFYDGNFYHNNGRWMNQHGIITLAYTMAAIFSDNNAWYQESVEWATTNKTATYKGQSGDIYHQIRYVTQNERTGEPVEPHVQLVEMFRDMGHASGNTSTLSMIAYMAELQGTKVNPDPASPTFGEITDASNGVGIFEFLDDRILAGANVLAQYNLGYDILYTPVNISNAVIGDPAGNYAVTVSDNGRGLGYASELTYGYYTHHVDHPLDPSDERIKYLHQAMEKLGGLGAFPSYILLQGTEDLSTGTVIGPPMPLSQPTYSEVKASYNRMQAFDFIGRSPTTSTNIFQDQDGMRSVLYDVRYENQYTWYDLNLTDSYNNITIRAASNSSAGTKVDVILLDNVAGIDRANVTADDLAKGEVLTTLQVPNTGWWTTYATVSGKLNRPLSGNHMIAFKYYGSTNWLSYQIAFDWFAFSDYYAGDENMALNGVLTEPATANEIGVELEDGGSVSFNKMNFDSGNNHAEFTAITSDSNGKILLYSDEQLVTTYNLINTNGSLVKFTSEIPIADIAKIAGIHDIKLKYEGSSPMILKTYRNLERNRLVTEETATTSKAMQIEDQAISIEGEFNVGTEAQRAYVEAADGSIIYLSKGALQVDRTKDSIVSFTVKSNGKADLHLQRDRSTTPFASISIPDTKGEWIKVSTNISNKYVNPDHYPTNLKSVFLSISADDQETKLRLDNYVLDPAEAPPVIKLISEQGLELQTVDAYENGEDFTLLASVEDPDSISVTLTSDNPSFMESDFTAENSGTLTMKTEGLAAGEYDFHIFALDDTDNYVDKPYKLRIYPEEEFHAPDNLAASLSGPDSIDIQWTIVNGASYYAIYRKEGVNGTYTKVNETTSTRLTDSNLPIGTYYYKVSAGSNAGESPLSGEASVTTLASVSVKASMVKANTNLWPGTGTPEGNGWLAFDGNTATSPDAITNPAWILIDFGAGHAKTIRGLKFYPRSTNVSRMNGAVIQGSDDGATFVDLYTINGITETKWQFVSFENNHAYRYMRYYTPNGNANVAELQFYKDAMENSAPIIADLSPLTIHSGETVAQTISAHDEDGDAISLEAADLPDGAQWHASTGEFSWTPETAGTYTLHFKATDARGAESTKSWLITVIEGTLPAPDNLTASLSAPNSVDLQWTAVQGASYYAIYRKAGTTGAFTKVSETTATKWTDSNLQPETYFYRVSAGGYAGESSQSEAAAVETLALLTIDATMVKANTNLWPGTGTPEENGWLAFDGKTATSPDAITNPAWILIDLGAGNEQIVGGVMFYPRSANVNRMNGAVVQGSDDGVTFVDLYTINGITAAKWHFVPINNNEAYRYLRYYTPKGNANVAELQFYNKANELPNNAPLIAELSPVSIHLGETVTQTITVTDEDGDFVSLEGVNLPEGAEWDAATGVFSWTPETQGTYTLEFKATDAHGAETIASWLITVTEYTQPEGNPKATLSGPAEARASSSVQLNIGVHGVEEGFTTAQIVLHYDPATLEIATMENEQGQLVLEDGAVTTSEEGIQVIGTGVKPEEGEILLLVANTNSEIMIAGSDNLIILHGLVKAAPPESVSVNVLSAEVSKDGASTLLDTSEASLIILITADKEVLQAAIQHAQQLLEDAVVGSSPGQYPAAAKSAFQLAIQNAVNFSGNSLATQDDVEAALIDLNRAVTAFQSSVHAVQPNPADKSVLNGRIQLVQAKLNKAVAGTKIGQYPAQAIEALQSSLELAMIVNVKVGASQAEVDASAASLLTADGIFAAQLITLVQGQTKVTINDLSLIAKYYGMKSTDANWSVIEKADLFGQGEISIRELAAVAQMIVGDWLAE